MKFRKSSIILFLIFGSVTLSLFMFYFHHTNVTVNNNNSSADHLYDVINTLERQHEELHSVMSALAAGAVSAEDKGFKSEIQDIIENHKEETKKIVDGLALLTSNPTIKPTIINQHDTVRKNNDIKDNVLIVGGTDGSGTRSVVQFLTLLGVSMVSEDPETYDIHADLVGGWPPVVSPVIKYAKKLDYDLNIDFPNDFKDTSLNKINQIISQVKIDSNKPTSYKLAVGGVLPKPINIIANAISHGFKAPVSMTLLPFWYHIIPNLKFLHVVRDGRDIAFSANQGPVEKFYNDMYNGKVNLRNNEASSIRAIRLWSDWNVQINNWAKLHLNKDKNTKSFDYLLLHTEDIVSTNIDIKYNALKDLANFVNSNADDKYICCLARKGSSFMGSHDRTPRKKAKDSTVTSRYGKWKNILNNNDNLRNDIYAAGQVGLSTFGYEPIRNIDLKHGLCTLTENDCKEINQDNIKDQSKLYGNDDTCTIHIGVDYKGGDITSFKMNNDKNECCKRCKNVPGCKFFTIDLNADICYLKSSQESTQEDLFGRLISGDVVA